MITRFYFFHRRYINFKSYRGTRQCIRVGGSGRNQAKEQGKNMRGERKRKEQELKERDVLMNNGLPCLLQKGVCFVLFYSWAEYI